MDLVNLRPWHILMYIQNLSDPSFGLKDNQGMKDKICFVLQTALEFCIIYLIDLVQGSGQEQVL